MTTARAESTLPSDRPSRYWPGSPDRDMACRMKMKFVPRVQACWKVSYASLDPVTPWAKPG